MGDSLPPDKMQQHAAEHRIRDMESTRSLSKEERDAAGIIYPSMDDDRLLNVYRDLRNKLLKLSDYQNFVCLVSAIAPSDETSLLALNLAAVMAFDRARSAIVIDCDTEESIIDALAEMDHAQGGIIDFIDTGREDIGQLLHESGLDRVRIVPSGHHVETRTESLESEFMRQIVLELKARYPDRYVFVNAPSLRLSSEVQILSNVCDFVLFQVRTGAVTEQQIGDAIEMIGPERVAGIVLRES